VTQLEAMRREAALWRAGLRSGTVACVCRSKWGYPVNQHRGPKGGQLCAFVYAVGRIYELERRLEVGHPESLT
jgi:hypothetical protein